MPRTVDDFLLEIAARPNDLALRAVFADWLLEQGDPLGEFIAIQLRPEKTPAERERERKLFALHAKAWLPPALKGVVAPWSQRFEKGVLVGCRLLPKAPETIAAARLDPRWATVRALAAPPLELIDECPQLESLTDLSTPLLDALVLGRSPMRSLRELGGRFSLRALRALCDAQGWDALSTVSVYGGPAGLSTRQYHRSLVQLELEEPDGPPMPRVDHGLRPSRLQWLFVSPLARQLGRLELFAGFIDLAAFLDELEAIDTPLRELVLRDSDPEVDGADGCGRWGIALKRGLRGWRSVEILPGDPEHRRDDALLVHEILRSARPATFHEAVLPKQNLLRAGRLPCLRKASRRFVD